LVSNMDIETIEDLTKALEETGYSDKAITEIIKWYNTNHLLMK
jgi:microsomal dipeptidase-like Zn-dependent dipeptidase